MDLTAETFAEAFRDRHRFRGQSEGEAAAWLFSIARHQSSRYVCRGKAEPGRCSGFRISRKGAAWARGSLAMPPIVDPAGQEEVPKPHERPGSPIRYRALSIRTGG